MLLDMREVSSVDCSRAGVCADQVPLNCEAISVGASQERHWCPQGHAGEIIPAILAADPSYATGFNEALVQSNGFRFALRYVGDSELLSKSVPLIEASRPLIVHSWRPSDLLAHMRVHSIAMTRVVLPVEECGEIGGVEVGDWSCDFKPEELRKISSLEIEDDPITMEFLSRFELPERMSQQADAGADSAPLAGAGIRELMDTLARMKGLDKKSTRSSTSAEIFEVACDWVRQNEVSGLQWSNWIEIRATPWFADTLFVEYRVATMLILIVASFAFFLFVENPFLWTTLSPVVVKKILEKNKETHWRSEVEQRLLKGQTDVVGRSLAKGPSTSNVALPDLYWQGLGDRATQASNTAFWEKVETWQREACAWTDVQEDAPPHEDYVYLAHHTFPCLQENGEVRILLCRSTAGVNSGKAMSVEVTIEECGGGASKGKDFTAGEMTVLFKPGARYACLKVPVVFHVGVWQNSYWFQARLTKVLQGNGILAWPQKAVVLVLDEQRFPAALPNSMRGGEGVSLVRYFIYSDRIRRGEKWNKTMLAMCWIPVHSVFITTFVQKLLVDNSLQGILDNRGRSGEGWYYHECILLAFVQLFSLGLQRWADVVQTRNRGRTGGCRQYHRANLLRKFMHLEHSEHWIASDAHWLYALMYDADHITGKAYFQSFVICQSLVGLSLSLFLIFYFSFSSGSLQSIWYVAVVFLTIPLGILVVWWRRKLTWKTVIARKKGETLWFGSVTWILSNWRQFSGLLWSERVALEKRVIDEEKKKYVPNHQTARDTMNDTSWLVKWIEGVCYCFILLFGVFALIEYRVYGIGEMTVGTYYACLRICVSVGKSLRKLAASFVDIQRAIVSLREIAALLNQKGQQPHHRDARAWAKSLQDENNPEFPYQGIDRLVLKKGIVFDADMCFLRPADQKFGMTFGDMQLKKNFTIPFGHTVHVSAKSERVVSTFLALVAGVLTPTGPNGEAYDIDMPGVRCQFGIMRVMVPMVHAGMGTTAPKIIEQLEFTGAPKDLCSALAEVAGLDHTEETARLPMGSSQVFSIVKAILVDPDVLCIFRPLALMPLDVRGKVEMLLRLWQAGGGLPRVAEFLGVPLPEDHLRIHRSSRRTLVIGNPLEELWGNFELDAYLDLDDYLAKPEGQEKEPEVEKEVHLGLQKQPDTVPHGSLGQMLPEQVPDLDAQQGQQLTTDKTV